MGPIGGGTLTVAGTATNAQIGSGTATSTTGDVVYNWAAAPNTAGLYLAEWEVTFVAGTVQTFPNAGYVTVLVTADL